MAVHKAEVTKIFRDIYRFVPDQDQGNCHVPYKIIIPPSQLVPLKFLNFLNFKNRDRRFPGGTRTPQRICHFSSFSIILLSLLSFNLQSYPLFYLH
ncbi:unnamed protein product [Penicillium roqueforti FM164]|uniref:Genomic scaffold, ProqFM164S01 n=1 Tax=Penicillium roqueforti (strain FM164) TaxID=1365484 RepID=W6PZ39_PENRF|nr:unnamed protein product [Penicillium roqueforti FM164]